MLRSPAVVFSSAGGKKAHRLNLFLLNIVSISFWPFKADFSQRFPSRRKWSYSSILIPVLSCQVTSETYYSRISPVIVIRGGGGGGYKWAMKRSMVDINLASSLSVQSVEQFVTWWGTTLIRVFPRMLWERTYCIPTCWNWLINMSTAIIRLLSTSESI